LCTNKHAMHIVHEFCGILQYNARSRINMYSFSKCFYPKELTNEECTKQFTLEAAVTLEVLAIQRFKHCLE